MVELDVGHDRAFRVMQDQAAVRFVDLGDEPLRATRASTGTVADQHRGIKAGFREDVPGHVRDRGLAGAASHRDRIGFGDELGQHLSAGQHLHAHRFRGVELR